VRDLSDDPAADDAYFEDLTKLNPLAPEGSIAEDLRAHLLRNFGPLAAENGGEMLLQSPLTRSRARGPGYTGD
jgi:hypothetical protein